MYILRNPIFLWIFRRGSPLWIRIWECLCFWPHWQSDLLTNVVINRSSLCQEPAEVFYEIWQNQLTGSWSTFPFQISDAWLYDNIYHILPNKYPYALNPSPSWIFMLGSTQIYIDIVSSNCDNVASLVFTYQFLKKSVDDENSLKVSQHAKS